MEKGENTGPFIFDIDDIPNLKKLGRRFHGY